MSTELISTKDASKQLKLPGRTLRRWVALHKLGQKVAGRHVLSGKDIQVLNQLSKKRDAT